jgi:hypothetical protein
LVGSEEALTRPAHRLLEHLGADVARRAQVIEAKPRQLARFLERLAVFSNRTRELARDPSIPPYEPPTLSPATAILVERAAQEQGDEATSVAEEADALAGDAELAADDDARSVFEQDDGYASDAEDEVAPSPTRQRPRVTSMSQSLHRKSFALLRPPDIGARPAQRPRAYTLATPLSNVGQEPLAKLETMLEALEVTTRAKDDELERTASRLRTQIERIDATEAQIGVSMQALRDTNTQVHNVWTELGPAHVPHSWSIFWI